MSTAENSYGDVMVVGGGISGLAAAYYYRKRFGPDVRVLILENHDDFGGHAKRLWRSLGELDMKSPVTEDELLEIHRELVARNGIDEGLVYLQITRGAADRDFVFPEGATPTIVLFTQAKPGLATQEVDGGITR